MDEVIRYGYGGRVFQLENHGRYIEIALGCRVAWAGVNPDHGTNDAPFTYATSYESVSEEGILRSDVWCQTAREAVNGACRFLLVMEVVSAIDPVRAEEELQDFIAELLKREYGCP